ncbi:MAG: hypothetical protein KAW93_05200 [Methanogenium sp.]|nr:hypothetical protein [Methanogenium sp.]
MMNRPPFRLSVRIIVRLLQASIKPAVNCLNPEMIGIIPLCAGAKEYRIIIELFMVRSDNSFH